MRPAGAWLMFVVGLLLVALGYAIRYGETYRRLLDQETEFVSDPEALTEFVGRWTIVAGALVGAVGVAPDPLWSDAFRIVAVVVLGAVSLYVFVGAWRIARSPATKPE